MRTTNGPAHHQRVKKVMKKARGFYAGPGKQYRRAKNAVMKAENHAFIGRKLKKREMRRLWITRLNIASREHGLPYSRLIAGLQKADIRMDRKQLSELAIHQPEAFKQVVEQARAALTA